MPADLAPIVIIAARNEADRIGQALVALGESFPGAALYVADDASDDATREIAEALEARVVSRDRPAGKGGNVTLAAEAALAEQEAAEERIVLLCDADLGASAEALRPLVDAIAAGEADLTIAAFRRRVGGGVGAALGFSRWATEKRAGVRLGAPISGQRALTGSSLRRLLPFAPRYGMETGMNIDAIRAGMRIEEIELDLEHRATGRTLGGFIHRGRQLKDFMLVYLSRRKPG